MSKKSQLHAPKAIHLGMGNRVRLQVLDRGRVVRELPWQPNLILDLGMDNLATVLSGDLYKYCVVGTGNTPTEDDSGAITITTSGATATSSAPFFAAGDFGKVLRCDTGEKAYITGYTSSTVVTLGAALAVTAQLFKLYRVAQTALATETMRSNTYVTTAGSCFKSRSGSTITSQRTYDFTAFSIAGSASSGTDLLTAAGNQLIVNDVVVLSGGTAPSPLVLGTNYYARDISGNDFKLAATPGGAAIDLTTAGSGFSVQLPRNFAEVGFSNLVTVGANLNSRALFAGGAVTVLAGQQLRVVYQFQITLAPTTPRAKTYAITGWPLLEQAVTADAGTDAITLTSHGFTANMPLSFVGTTAPAGLTFATTYYARDITTHTFKVSATPGGTAIDLTTAGTGVFVKTHTEGDEQIEVVSLSAVATSGNTVAFDTAIGETYLGNEPAYASSLIYLSTDGTLFGFPVTTATGVATLPTFAAASLDAYANGTFTRTKRGTFSVAQNVSVAIRSMGISVDTAFIGGLRCVFDQKQEKNSVSTLELVFRWTWDRIFV